MKIKDLKIKEFATIETPIRAGILPQAASDAEFVTLKGYDAAEGDKYWNTTDKVTRKFDGSTWANDSGGSDPRIISTEIVVNITGGGSALQDWINANLSGKIITDTGHVLINLDANTYNSPEIISVGFSTKSKHDSGTGLITIKGVDTGTEMEGKGILYVSGLAPNGHTEYVWHGPQYFTIAEFVIDSTDAMHIEVDSSTVNLYDYLASGDTVTIMDDSSTSTDMIVDYVEEYTHIVHFTTDIPSLASYGCYFYAPRSTRMNTNQTFIESDSKIKFECVDFEGNVKSTGNSYTIFYRCTFYVYCAFGSDVDITYCGFRDGVGVEGGKVSLINCLIYSSSPNTQPISVSSYVTSFPSSLEGNYLSIYSGATGIDSRAITVLGVGSKIILSYFYCLTRGSGILATESGSCEVEYSDSPSCVLRHLGTPTDEVGVDVMHGGICTTSYELIIDNFLIGMRDRKNSVMATSQAISFIGCVKDRVSDKPFSKFLSTAEYNTYITSLDNPITDGASLWNMTTNSPWIYQSSISAWIEMVIKNGKALPSFANDTAYETAFGTGTENTLYWQSTLKKVRFHNGTQWDTLGEQAHTPSIIENAETKTADFTAEFNKKYLINSTGMIKATLPSVTSSDVGKDIEFMLIDDGILWCLPASNEGIYSIYGATLSENTASNYIKDAYCQIGIKYIKFKITATEAGKWVLLENSLYGKEKKPSGTKDLSGVNGACYAANTGMLYFAPSSANTIWKKVNPKTLADSNITVYGTAIVFKGLCYAPNNGYIYASYVDTNNYVKVFDPINETTITDISLGTSTTLRNTILYCPYNSYIYVLGIQSIYVIDTSTNTLITTISSLNPNSSSFLEMAFCPTNNRLYVPHYGIYVSVIDVETNSLVTTLADSAVIGNSPSSIVYSPITQKIYIRTADSSGYMTFKLLNPSDNTVYKTISPSNGYTYGHFGFAISSIDNNIYFHSSTNRPGFISLTELNPMVGPMTSPNTVSAYSSNMVHFVPYLNAIIAQVSGILYKYC